MALTSGRVESHDTLRRLERRVLRLIEPGVDDVEIARRFRRSPAMIRRIVGFSGIARRPPAARTGAPRLRSLEQRILRWRAGGSDHVDIGRRFGRTPDHVRRVEALARYKLRND
jgi:DNA-binding CsgD family transcriptional regulator